MDLAAREQVRRSPDFDAVNLKKDPLELWKLINTMLIVVGHTDKDEARHAASRSLAMYTQRDLSLGVYYQGFKDRLERAVELGAAKQPDMDIAMDFIHRLNPKYKKLLEYYANKVKPKPKNLLEAYNDAT